MNPALLALLGARVAASSLTATFGGTATAGGVGPVFTFTDMPIGDASAARTVVVAVTWRTENTTATISVTIGGVSATIDANIRNGWQRVTFARATVPTGTTADVVVTSSAVIRNHGVAVATWSMPVGVTAVTSGSATTSGAGVTLSASAGAILCGSGSAYSTGHAWTGATERFDISAGLTKMSGADATTTGGSATVSATGEGSAVDPVTVAVNYAAA